MDFFDVVAARRSIRKFVSDPVSDEQLTQILEAGRLAPSGTNAQPWAFLVVQDEAARAKLMAAAKDQPFVGQAPAVIIVCGDTKRFKKRLRRGRELAETGAIDSETIAKVQAAYKERARDAASELRSIVANCCIAAEHMVLAATALGLGSCWVMLMDAEEVAATLDLPDHLFPVALLPVGVPDQDPPQRQRYPLDEIACRERANLPWTAPDA